MRLTQQPWIADNLEGLSEVDMADRVPSNVFIIRAVPTGNGKFLAYYSAPGFYPEYAKDGAGTPFEFVSERDAELAAALAMVDVLNKPRVNSRRSQGKPEKYSKLSGPEFAVLLRKADITPSFLAYLYGSPQTRVISWIDGVDDVPHPVRILLEIFSAFPETIDLAEKVTQQVTTSQRRSSD